MTRDGLLEGGSLTIEWPGAGAASVSITGHRSGTATRGSSSASFPYDMSAETTWDFSENCTVTVVITYLSVELLNQDYRIHDSSETRIQPGIDFNITTLENVLGAVLQEGGGSVGAETSRASAAESTLQSNINAKASTAALTTEVDRATAAEVAAQAYAIDRAHHTGSQAQSTVTNLVSDLAAKATTTALTTETSRATAAEDVLTTNVNTRATSTELTTETSRATAAEVALTSSVGTVASDLATESTRATTAEGTLQAKAVLPYFVGLPSGGDDTAAFATAIASGRPVALSPGTYKHSGDIAPTIKLSGAGMNRTTIQVTGNGRGIIVENTANVTLEDFTLDMNKAATTGGADNSGQHGIYVHASNSTGCPDTKIRRVRVKNGWFKGIEAKAATLTTHPLGVVIEDCESFDNGTNASQTGALGINCENVQNAEVRRCTVLRNGGYGIRASGCASAAVVDNRVDDHQNNHGIVVNNGTVNFTITGNRVTRCVAASGQTQWGIVVGVSGAKFVVADNVCDSNNGGITIDVAVDLHPETFVNTLGVVANNVCSNSTRSNAGLNVNHVDGLVIIGNTSAYNTYTTGAGISITGRNCIVIGNIVHHNNRRGIQFLESTDGCGPHFYGPNYVYSNNQAGASWPDYYTDVLTNGAVKSTLSGVVDSSETTTTVANTLTETSVVSLATGSNPTPEAGDRYVLRFNGEVLNNSGGAVTYAFRVKIGTTSVALSNALSLTSGATTRPFSGEVTIALASVSSQIVSGHMIGFQASSGGFQLGTAGAYGALKGTAAEDLSTSKNVIVQATMGTANASASVSILSASLERIPKR